MFSHACLPYVMQPNVDFSPANSDISTLCSAHKIVIDGYNFQLQTPGLAVAPKVEMKKRNKKKNLHGLLKIQKLHELRKFKKKT